MKTILTLFLTVLLHSTYCQSIDSLSKSKLLNELSENACKCIDSINVNNIDHKKVTEEVNRCITAQIGAYQIGIKLMEIDSLSKIALEKDGKKEINISIEFDENSDVYKKYYYDMERYLMDNCSSIKSKIAVNDKESTKSLSSNPKALELYSKGLKEVDKEKYAEAIEYFDKALKIDPDFAFAWDYLGLCHRKAGNYDKAIIAYENSLKVDPEGIMPLQNIAVAYAYKMEYTKAIEAYQRLAKIDDKNPEVYYGIGNIYTMHLSDYENGLKYMCKAYNLYIEQKSPYRTDAEKIINIIYSEMKKQGKENRFVEILKENNIRTEQYFVSRNIAIAQLASAWSPDQPILNIGMNTSQNKYDAIEHIIFQQGLRITSLELSPENDKLFIHLNTNLTFVTPTKNYSRLKNASIKRLKNYRLVGSGVGIHWPDLDEDLSLKGFLKEFLSQKVKARRKLIIA